MSVFKQLFFALMPLLFMQIVAAEPAAPKRERGTVLVVMTNHSQYPSRNDHTGLWLTELTHVYDALKEAGYGVDFVSPNGGAVPLDERSLGYKGFLPFGSFVMTDGRLVTGQNPGSGKEVAQALLAALRNNKPE